MILQIKQILLLFNIKIFRDYFIEQDFFLILINQSVLD